MESNTKLYKTALISVAILLILSLIFINYIKLDQPVFFKHYFDIRSYNAGEYYEEIPFALKYITNVEDSRRVAYISFPEHPEVAIQASEDEYMSGMHWGYGPNNYSNENYGRYSVRTVFCNIVYLPEDMYDDLAITKAIIGFNDSSEISIDIGTLHVYKAELTTDVLGNYYSSSSSDGVSEDRYNILEDVKFESLESSLLGQISDQVELNMNDIEISKATGSFFETWEQINIISQQKSTGDLLKDYSLFDIHPKLIFSDKNGHRHSTRILNINNIYSNDYNFINLFRYIKERQGA